MKRPWCPDPKPKQRPKNPYRGIRKRGKWVAEVSGRNNCRIWLGTYSSPVAAARAYDAAVFYLRGPTARFNFPEYVAEYAAVHQKDLSPDAIRKMATEVGERVDALETTGPDSTTRPAQKPDLDECPSPESSKEN